MHVLTSFDMSVIKVLSFCFLIYTVCHESHFHYGYHIYAAAILSYFDAEWGKAHFEEVLLLIRDIANPSLEDKYFPIFRHKDLYIGNSWASGISTIGGQPFLNGRNQESSSEAIAAYEGISLYGYIMVSY